LLYAHVPSTFIDVGVLMQLAGKLIPYVLALVLNDAAPSHVGLLALR
jgi:hypothetical protein